MKQVGVDFNTLNSEPAGLVKIASPRSRRTLPPFEQGERVLLVDSDLEAEGEIILEAGWIMARPDPTTYRDLPVSDEADRDASLPQA